MRLPCPKGADGTLKRSPPIYDRETGEFLVGLIQRPDTQLPDPKANMDREIDALEKLEGGPFVRMIAHGEMTDPDHPEEEGTSAMIMGKMHGDLSSAMEERKMTQGQNPLILAKGVGESLKSLHDKKLLHRDLKPDNILVSWNDEAHTQLKETRVSDFDWTMDCSESFPDEEEMLLEQLSDVAYGVFDYWTWTPEEVFLRKHGTLFKEAFAITHGLSDDIVD